MIVDALVTVLEKNALITAFAFVGILVWFSYEISARLTRGHIHGSAIAIALGLVLAWVGGTVTGRGGDIVFFLVHPSPRERSFASPPSSRRPMTRAV